MKRSLWLYMLLVLFFSCVKEENEYPVVHSRQIGYSVGVGSGTGSGTRSAAGNTDASMSGELRSTRKVEFSNLEQKVGNSSIYLHTISEDRSDYLKNLSKADIVVTKGAINSSISSLGISACVYNGDEFSGGKVYMANDKSVSPSWSSSRYWPKDYDHTRFFAYAPYDILIGDSGSDYLRLPSVGTWDGNNPSFTYTVPNEISNHTDILVASSDVGKVDYGKPAHLEFGHALTAIQFMVDGLHHVNIKKITISGVPYNKGTYTYSYSGNNGDGVHTTPTHDAGTWSSLETVLPDNETDISYVLDLTAGGTNPNGYECKGEAEEILNDGNDVLFVMPQSLPDNTMLTMEAFDEYTGKDVSISASIGGQNKEWRKGEHLIYKISLTDVDVQYVLAVAGTEDSAPYYGQIGREYNVTSYKIIHKMGEQYPTYKAVPWKISSVSDWVDGITLSNGDGSTVTASGGLVTSATTDNGNYGVVAITPQWYNIYGKTSGGEEYSHWYSSHHALADNTVLGSEGHSYDLSVMPEASAQLPADDNAENSPVHTANCYIVSAPGYYKLPLVYGNAIKGGSDNKNAYNPSVSQGASSAQQMLCDKSNPSNYITTEITESVAVFVLTPFVDHKGTGITTPWIVSNNGRKGTYEAGSADIVWQDQPCLLTDVKLNSDKDYLLFRVREDCITEGNAVVAVKDESGTIMWSWHIWVTDGRNIYDDPAGGVLSFNPEDKNLGIGIDGLREVENRVVVNTSDGVRFKQNKFHMLNAPLGHCDGEGRKYEPRTGSIVFQQVDNGNDVGTPASHYISQGGTQSITIITPDNSVYYQYGRKDPMLPGYEKNGTIENKIFYLGNRTQVTSYGTPTSANNEVGFVAAQTSIAMAIQHPGIFYSKGNTRDFPTINSSDVDYILVNHWCNEGVYYNLWDATNNKLPMFAYTQDMNDSKYGFFDNFKDAISDEVVKTVYDPSPRGYEIPRTDAFTGFTYDGLRRSNNTRSGINITGETWDRYTAYNGYTFFETPMPNEGWVDTENTGKDNTILIPALGHRNGRTGKIDQYGRYGSALTTIPICIQWAIEGSTYYQDYTNPENATSMRDGDKANNYFQLQLSRLCYINSSKVNGDVVGNRSFRPISSSDFDYAFPIVPVKTGYNPLSGSEKIVVPGS